jgi:hypothetical protein
VKQLKSWVGYKVNGVGDEAGDTITINAETVLEAFLNNVGLGNIFLSC